MENTPKQTFEDLLIWKESMKMCKEIYRLFKDSRDFGFKDQIQRTSVSVPSIIAEGFKRQSSKEFIQYLYIAKASNGELRTQLLLAIELNIIEEKIGLNLVEQAKRISAMIQSLINIRKNGKRYLLLPSPLTLNR